MLECEAISIRLFAIDKYRDKYIYSIKCFFEILLLGRIEQQQRSKISRFFNSSVFFGRLRLTCKSLRKSALRTSFNDALEQLDRLVRNLFCGDRTRYRTDKFYESKTHPQCTRGSWFCRTCSSVGCPHTCSRYTCSQLNILSRLRSS